MRAVTRTISPSAGSATQCADGVCLHSIPKRTRELGLFCWAAQVHCGEDEAKLLSAARVISR
jgi:hypothetical protein